MSKIKEYMEYYFIKNYEFEVVYGKDKLILVFENDRKFEVVIKRYTKKLIE